MLNASITSAVFNLGNFEEGHFHSDENLTLPKIPLHLMLKNAHSSFSKGPFDEKGGQWPHGPLKIENCISLLGAKSNKNVVQQKGQRITYILT